MENAKVPLTLLTGRYDEAERLLNDKDQMERFLQRLEKKLKTVPLAGEKLSYLPILVSLLRSYIKKIYTDVPIGTIISIVAATLYFVSPIDLIPDTIPGVGHVDDALVIAACWNLVQSDVEEYVEWRKINGKEYDL